MYSCLRAPVLNASHRILPGSVKHVWRTRSVNCKQNPTETKACRKYTWRKSTWNR